MVKALLPSVTWVQTKVDDRSMLQNVIKRELGEGSAPLVVQCSTRRVSGFGMLWWSGENLLVLGKWNAGCYPV